MEVRSRGKRSFHTACVLCAQVWWSDALGELCERWPAAEEWTDLIVEALQGMAGVEGPGGSGREPESDPIAIEISG